VTNYGINQGYSANLAKNYIAAIRTDLDSFSDAEASVLENHGYWLADAAIKTHIPSLLPELLPPLQVPNPEWVGPEDKSSKLSVVAARELFWAGKLSGTSRLRSGARFKCTKCEETDSWCSLLLEMGRR
jgi:hypothetical protein